LTRNIEELVKKGLIQIFKAKTDEEETERFDEAKKSMEEEEGDYPRGVWS